MRITTVRAIDWMGYEDVDLDLDGVGQVVVVGDNGAGKSSLLDALTWALYDRVSRPDLASKDALIRSGADETLVTVAFESVGRDVTVVRAKQRGRTGTLALYVDGEPRTAHTVRETFEAIERIIGLSYDSLMAGPVMAQETAGAFMRARPAERKMLLGRLFALDRYEALHSAASDRRRAAEADLAAAERMVDELAPRTRAEAEVTERLATARGALAARLEAQSLAADRMAATKDRLTEARTRAEAYAATTTLRRATAERLAVVMKDKAKTAGDIALDETALATAPRTYDPAELTAAEEVWLARRQDAVRLAWLADAVPRAEREHRLFSGMAATREQVPCHGEGIYATCPLLASAPEPAVIEASKDRLAALVAEAEGLAGTEAAERQARVAVEYHRATRAAADVDERARSNRLATLDQRRERLRLLDDTVAALRSDVDRLAAQEAKESKAAEAVVGLSEELAEAQQVYNIVRGEAEQVANEVRGLEASLDLIAQAKRDLATWTARRTAAHDESTVWGVLAEAFHRDGIPTTILAAGIPLIESEANRVLDTLPGGLAVTLRTEREKASGGMADTLDVVVTVGGWEREYGLLSVGQRFRVDLALRLGLARVLTHRTGATIETLWLDEPLAALDANGRDAVIETLAALADQFGLIVVVSHQPDINDRFPARIDVRMEDGVSTAVLTA